jgi:hypothetical protein
MLCFVAFNELLCTNGDLVLNLTNVSSAKDEHLKTIQGSQSKILISHIGFFSNLSTSLFYKVNICFNLFYIDIKRRYKQTSAEVMNQNPIYYHKKLHN